MAFRWTGEAMEPLHPRLADKHFVVGERYMLVPHEERSAASHAHYFASIAEYHNSLPDELALLHPTPDHLRRFALIKAGFHDSHSIVASSKAEAQRIAAFIKPADAFAVVLVEGATVTRYTARSQSMRAMGKAEFARSKDAVLLYLADLLGVDPATHERHGRAA